TDHVVWHGAVQDRDAHHGLLRAVDRLANRLGDFLGLAEAEADAAVGVAHHHERREAEAPAALHDLRHAVDVDDLFLQLHAFGVADPSLASATCLRHACVLLKLEAALARAFGDRANASVVEEAVAVEHDCLDPVLETPLGDQNADLLGGTDRGRLALLAYRRR